MAEPAEDKELAMLKEHVAQLGQHFDTVHIFVTRVSPKEGGTINANWGDGNWYARYGQVHNWFIRQDAISRREALEQE